MLIIHLYGTITFTEGEGQRKKESKLGQVGAFSNEKLQNHEKERDGRRQTDRQTDLVRHSAQ